MMLRRLLVTVLLVGGVWYFAAGHSFLPGFSPVALLPGHGSMPISRSTAPLVLEEVKAAPEYDAEELTNIAVYKRLLPSVVNVTSTSLQMDFFYGPVPSQGQGSGFILDRQGHIATNYHVIADAQNIEVQLADKHRYKARIIGKDQRHDLALLQIDAPNLQPVLLAESHDLVPGQKVYAIGNPFGLSGTMTTGIISAIRSIHGPEGGQIENAIQTDAAINPGNSGGPLLNSRGEVIGINSLIATNPNQSVDQSAGIGFAIPIDTVKAVLADIERYGHSRRPSLGVRSLPIGPELAQQMGLAANSGMLIEQTVPGGAAQQAGLRGGSERAYLGNMQIVLGGDLIVAIDGQAVTAAEDISDLMDKHQVGDAVSVTFYRGQRKMTVRVTLGEAGQQQA
ncbi:S1C family serine protease [Acidipila sp. EB88]|uniref:S1C family serine protease n=1 Tax=Acidipila sp. EB88 TaxID=2305226 RepID=UPI000F5EB391|nr:trypsin-like peptidase domain-containing protein [Acidipila sp. EB88]RRA48332.1 PDZ domain-containing protein [Acidipila sp. EB88]